MRELKKELKYWENYRKEVLASGIPKMLKDEHLSEIEYHIVRVLSNIDEYKKQRKHKEILVGSIILITITIILLLLL